MRLFGHVVGMRERGSVYSVLAVKPEIKNHMRDADLGGILIIRWILRKKDMHCIELSQDRDRGRALVKVVMNLWVP